MYINFYYASAIKKFPLFVCIKSNISDEDLSNKFTLVDSEGHDITQQHKLGLLLYRGGTVCNHRWNRGFGFKAADAICKEMNFKYAERWTTKESFDIQSNYNITLGNIGCGSKYSANWAGCSHSENTIYCGHYEDVFLSCTSNLATKTALVIFLIKISDMIRLVRFYHLKFKVSL